MALTVIGMFDNPTEARQAVEKLSNEGFSRDAIQMTDAGAAESAEDVQKGGVSNFFRNLFGREEDSNKYVRLATYSETLVTVNVATNAEAEVAADILRQCGVVNIDHYVDAEPGVIATQPEITSSEEEAILSEKPVEVSRQQSDEVPGKTTRIPVTEENLKPVKCEILSDGLRLRSTMINHPVQQSVDDGEDAGIGKQDTDERPVRGNSFASFFPGEIELSEKSEVPIVSKEAHVVEEVRIGKEVRETTATISETERKTEINVEEG
jgi:stress response protein YsnF